MKAAKNIARFDRSPVSGAEVTDEGYLRANAIVSRTGVFNYMGENGEVRKELRHPDDVFNFESLESLKMRPVTDNHPDQKLLNAENAKGLAIGWTGENVRVDGQYLIAPLMITDSQAVQAVQTGSKQELSLGYTVDLVRQEGVYNGQEYTHRQTNIRYNHVAIVERGRAGPNARINLDEAMVITDLDYKNLNKERLKMSEEKLTSITLDGLDYKAAPEVINAYKKQSKALESLQEKLDHDRNELEKLKAEKDSLEEKYAAEVNKDTDAIIREAAAARVNLINSVNKLLGENATEINVNDMNDFEIQKEVVSKLCPSAKLDEASEVYVQARFDHLLESNIERAGNINKQRVAVAPRVDAETKSEDEAKKRMEQRVKDAYKKDASRRNNNNK